MTDKPLRADDYVVEDPPAWLPSPVRRWLADLTYREWHAALLGLTGLFVGQGWAAGFRMEAAAFTITAIGLAFGLKQLPEGAPAGTRVIRREPWYFVVPYVVFTTVAALAPMVI